MSEGVQCTGHKFMNHTMEASLALVALKFIKKTEKIVEIRRNKLKLIYEV